VNLRVFGRVLSRFRYLVIAGVVAAIAVAMVSAFRIGLEGYSPRVEYRAEEKWQSVGTLFVTQPGFPWGRSLLDEVVPVGPDGEAGFVPKYADGGRFQGLALLYAELAQGDAVRAIVEGDGPIEGEYGAAPVRGPDGATSLPLIEIGAFAASPEQAEALAQRATDAFLTYLRQTQEENAIPVTRRVQVEVVARPGEAVLAEGRRMTRPIFLFVLMSSATVLLAFALENLRPRAPAQSGHVTPRPAQFHEVERKTA
jgi:hypothetical protein